VETFRGREVITVAIASIERCDRHGRRLAQRQDDYVAQLIERGELDSPADGDDPVVLSRLNDPGRLPYSLLNGAHRVARAISRGQTGIRAVVE
jgi:hypothetical protein